MIKIEDYNGVERISPTIFPDKTKLLKYVPNRMDCQKITWLYDSDEELFQIIALTKHLKNLGVDKIVLDMPYIPNARMDRIKSKDEVFTLKWFAETINWLGFDEVRVTNPHSTVSEALFDKVYVDFECVKEDVEEIVNGMNLGIDVLYYPDEGSCKRYGDVLKGMNMSNAFGIKKRDWKTGNILGLDVIDNGIDLNGKNILIVDDICSKGGTFYFSAKKLKELGVNKIYLYVTHCEDTILDGELVKDNGLIEKIFTTNSIFLGKNEKIEIIREF